MPAFAGMSGFCSTEQVLAVSASTCPIITSPDIDRLRAVDVCFERGEQTCAHPAAGVCYWTQFGQVD